MRARAGAISYVAGTKDLIPVGMTIGPFSFMTKLLADPISAVFMLGSGMTAEEEPEVGAVERLLDMCVEVILASMKSQVEAGAKAILVAEPAANLVYLSPKQLAAGSDVFERCVMRHNRRLVDYLASQGVDLIFHDCGELTDGILKQLASLHPMVLSLGSSRVLWEDAKIVPQDVVLFGNLPSKKFYSDEAMPVKEVERRACEMLSKMKLANHPYILGSECDVLHVPGAAEIINRKVDAFMNVKC
jgi:uroporphyrinogen-III decarboxylase